MLILVVARSIARWQRSSMDVNTCLDHKKGRKLNKILIIFTSLRDSGLNCLKTVMVVLHVSRRRQTLPTNLTLVLFNGPLWVLLQRDKPIKFEGSYVTLFKRVNHLYHSQVRIRCTRGIWFILWWRDYDPGSIHWDTKPIEENESKYLYFECDILPVRDEMAQNM